MSAAIPVATTALRILAHLTSPTQISDATIEAYQGMAMLALEQYSLAAAYAEATGANPGSSLATAFKFAYKDMMLAKLTRTYGQNLTNSGLIKATGLSESDNKELLTPDELTKQENAFELAALSTIYSYLNPAGQARLTELKTGTTNATTEVRGCLILP